MRGSERSASIFFFIIVAVVLHFSISFFITSRMESQHKELVTFINESDASKIASMISMKSSSISENDVLGLLNALQKEASSPLVCEVESEKKEQLKAFYIGSSGYRYIPAKNTAIQKYTESQCLSSAGVMGIKLRLSFCDYFARYPCGVEAFLLVP